MVGEVHWTYWPADIIDFHRFAARHCDATIESLALDSLGEVPWRTPERRQVTLHQILVHMCVETARHAGHADILRELKAEADLQPGF